MSEIKDTKDTSSFNDEKFLSNLNEIKRTKTKYDKIILFLCSCSISFFIVALIFARGASSSNGLEITSFIFLNITAFFLTMIISFEFVMIYDSIKNVIKRALENKKMKK